MMEIQMGKELSQELRANQDDVACLLRKAKYVEIKQICIRFGGPEDNYLLKKIKR